MTLVAIDTAMHHLRVDPDDQVDVARKLAAAEVMAANYMGRNIYADASAYALAQSLAVTIIDSIAAEPIADGATAGAHAVYLEAIKGKQQAAGRILRGIVIDPAIEAAILLILGTLYEHREDVLVGDSAAELPIAATHRLQPYRVMGV